MDLKRLGMIGTVFTALCCFTPLLTGLLAIVGFSWLIGYLDFVLFPALFLFIGITVYALWRDGHLSSNQAKKEIKDE